MRIIFDNVNFSSSSGPNSFAGKLAKSLMKMGHKINEGPECDVQLAFIQANQILGPIVQRLDGIYFNSEQDWKTLNKPIQETYNLATAVIFQSKFNKELTEKYFGKKPDNIVINNGTDLDLIEKIDPISHPELDKFENIWSCASSWRPHKRLSENVRYFLEHSSEKDCLVIAGNNPDYEINHERVFYVGSLSWHQLIALYKRSKYFLHLALMDHCPNVVVDARAAGCKIICSSSGGTKEIAGSNSVIIQDMDWDYLPFKLYEPCSLDFEKILDYNQSETSINIDDVAQNYLDLFERVVL
jgi:glycosyltransferase involved in cell wall biosynthesis